MTARPLSDAAIAADLREIARVFAHGDIPARLYSGVALTIHVSVASSAAVRECAGRLRRPPTRASVTVETRLDSSGDMHTWFEWDLGTVALSVYHIAKETGGVTS